jgi:hypothetical protein
MKEEFLHFIWKHYLFYHMQQLVADGKPVEVITPGNLNTNSGPDFNMVRIKIDGVTWAGDVEIHSRASDWNAHGHQHDAAYNAVVLHVVEKYDTDVYNANGEVVPTIELNYPQYYKTNYEELICTIPWVSCLNKRQVHVEPLHLRQWLVRLYVERLERKTGDIERVLKEFNNNWEQSFFIFLARSLGTNVNSMPFELLARSLPVTILAKHKHNVQQLEALLFGQAGLLSDSSDDEYFNTLKKEYDFLSVKYQLQPLEKSTWKFMRLRPVNFPTVRIAQLAALIYQSTKLFSKVTAAANLSELRRYFIVSVSPYWKTHFTFSKPTAFHSADLGAKTVDSILINTVVPFLIVYSDYYSKPEIKERAIDVMEQLPAETNRITMDWKLLSIIPFNALESQALIQLKNNYCDKKYCLHCHIGRKIITSAKNNNEPG